MSEYLFPFNHVKRDSKIIIYGAGEVGQTYLYQVKLTQYCDVICIVDRHYQKYTRLDVKVVAPIAIGNETFDFIVVAHSVPAIGNEIVSDLIGNHRIPREKIVYENSLVQPVSVYRDTEVIKVEGCFAYEQVGKYGIAVKLSGGIGDFIVRKNSVLKLARWHDNLSVDIFVEPEKLEFSKTLFMDVPCVNQIIPSIQEYRVQMNRYLVAFDFGLMLNVDFINNEKIMWMPSDLKSHIVNAYTMSKEYNLHGDWKICAIHYARCEKDGVDCYTSYGRYGLYDEKITTNMIPLLETYRELYIKLGLNHYITLNYGWDNRLGSMYPSAKVWPLEYYSQLAKSLKKQYPSVALIQIGLKESMIIDGCDQHIFGESIELIKYVLHGAMLHIDSEGGMVHLATQLGTKCVVMFGPTPVDYYGYKDNINIVSQGCKNCYWLVPDYISCYRKFERPECMYSILPEQVLGEVDDYFENAVVK